MSRPLLSAPCPWPPTDALARKSETPAFLSRRLVCSFRTRGSVCPAVSTTSTSHTTSNGSASKRPRVSGATSASSASASASSAYTSSDWDDGGTRLPPPSQRAAAAAATFPTPVPAFPTPEQARYHATHRRLSPDSNEDEDGYADEDEDEGGRELVKHSVDEYGGYGGDIEDAGAGADHGGAEVVPGKQRPMTNCDGTEVARRVMRHERMVGDAHVQHVCHSHNIHNTRVTQPPRNSLRSDTQASEPPRSSRKRQRALPDASSEQAKPSKRRRRPAARPIFFDLDALVGRLRDMYPTGEVVEMGPGWRCERV
ncbi:hypothetical protein Q5752_002456 [Cryptotrichosporon argae]